MMRQSRLTTPFRACSSNARSFCPDSRPFLLRRYRGQQGTCATEFRLNTRYTNKLLNLRTKRQMNFEIIHVSQIG